MEKKCVNLIVVGGGAAGLFAAIHAKGPVVLLEKSQKLLSKVKISGGGRCNVTHNCFDPLELTRFYPRGSKELRGPFTRFGPANVIDWFASKGVKLKVEADNRIFPTTDSSDTIINALLESAKDVEIMRGAAVTDIARIGEGYRVELRSGEVLFANHVMLATGSAPAGHRLAKTLGHTIVPPVPSLFTFNIPNFALAHLSGISIPNATVSLPAFKAEAQGPLLITHFGLSGPAVLKLSAFCARDLNRVGYATECRIRWVENFSEITSYRDLDLPKNLTKGLCSLAGVDPGFELTLAATGCDRQTDAHTYTSNQKVAEYPSLLGSAVHVIVTQ